MQFSIMQTDLRDRLVILDSNTLITTDMIKRWINQAKDWALSYKKWPFLESTGTDTIDSTGEYPYPTLMKLKSAFFVTVDGERYDKIRYEDYLKYLEDNSTGPDRVWAEFDRTIYINGNACDVGDAIIIYGQIGVIDLAGDTTKTPFDDAEPSGDEAIIRRATAVAMRIMGQGSLDRQAKIEENEAKELLEAIWTRVQENRPREVLKQTPRFTGINIVRGTRRRTNPNMIGRFNR